MKVCAVICRNDHCYASRAQKPHFCVKTTKDLGKIAHSDTKKPFSCSKRPKTGVTKAKKRTKMPILCSGASPMVGLIHSFNKYGRPASLYDLFWSPVRVLCSALCLPPRLRVSRSTLLILTHRANYVNSRIQRLLLRISPTLAESITAPLGRWGMTG